MEQLRDQRLQDVTHPPRAERLASLDLDEEHLAPAVRERQGKGRGDRRLPGAALAGHHMQAYRGEVRHEPTLRRAQKISVGSCRNEP